MKFLSEIWSEMFIPDVGSEFFSYPGHRFRIPDPEVNKALDPQQCLHIYLFFLFRLPVTFVLRSDVGLV